MPEFAEVADGLSMPLADAMRTQRAVRRLRSDPVDDETLLAVLELAVKAPTGQQRAGLGVRRRSATGREAPARPAQPPGLVDLPPGRHGSRARGDLQAARMLAAVQWQADHFENAPVIVVACLHGRPCPHAHGPRRYYGSIFPAVQNLLLAARSVGLGATLTTLPLWYRTLARRTLRLPPGSPRAPSSRSVGRCAAATGPPPAARSRRSSTSITTGTGRSSTGRDPAPRTGL